MNIYKLLCCASVLILFSCGFVQKPNANHSDVDIYHVLGAYEWNTSWYLNGQPAFIGYGDFIEDVTPFVINGKNVVEIKSEPTNKQDNTIPCNTILVKTEKATNGNEVVLGGIKQSETVLTTHDKKFSFDSTVPVRWSWQMADQLANILPDDTEEIILQIKKLQKVFVEQDSDELKKMKFLSWKVVNDLQNEQIDTSLQDRIELLWKKGAVKTAVADKGKIRILKGLKVILALSDMSSLINVEEYLKGKKTSGWHFSVDVKKVYFVKIDGKWRMLNMFGWN